MRKSSSLLQVYLFGHFSTECRGEIIAGLEARRLQEVFSYLLLNRHRRCSRDFLASLFWGESSTDQSKKNLRQVLWQLQTALETKKVAASEPILRITADWLQVNPRADLWLDVDCFERAWNEIKLMPGKDLDVSKVQLLRTAIGLHQEVLLPSNYEDWCLRERERLLSLLIAMLDKLMEYSEAHHDYETALRAGRRILEYDRVHEPTHQKLMRLYYFLGNRVEALKQYHRCEVSLREELGALPSRSTRTLYQLILLDQLEGDSSSETLMRDSQERTSLLEHTLEELKQVQNLYIYAQRQVDFHIQEIEQALCTLTDTTKDTVNSLE